MKAMKHAVKILSTILEPSSLHVMRLGLATWVKHAHHHRGKEHGHLAGLNSLDHMVWRWTHQATSRRFNLWKQEAHRDAQDAHSTHHVLTRLDKILLRMTHVVVGRALRQLWRRAWKARHHTRRSRHRSASGRGVQPRLR